MAATPAATTPAAATTVAAATEPHPTERGRRAGRGNGRGTRGRARMGGGGRNVDQPPSSPTDTFSMEGLDVMSSPTSAPPTPPAAAPSPNPPSPDTPTSFAFVPHSTPDREEEGTTDAASSPPAVTAQHDATANVSPLPCDAALGSPTSTTSTESSYFDTTPSPASSSPHVSLEAPPTPPVTRVITGVEPTRQWTAPRDTVDGAVHIPGDHATTAMTAPTDPAASPDPATPQAVPTVAAAAAPSKDAVGPGPRRSSMIPGTPTMESLRRAPAVAAAPPAANDTDDIESSAAAPGGAAVSLARSTTAQTSAGVGPRRRSSSVGASHTPQRRLTRTSTVAARPAAATTNAGAEAPLSSQPEGIDSDSTGAAHDGATAPSRTGTRVRAASLRAREAAAATAAENC